MEEIYIEGVQPKEQGNPACSIYKELLVKKGRLDNVPGLQDMMTQYGLQWLTHELG